MRRIILVISLLLCVTGCQLQQSIGEIDVMNSYNLTSSNRFDQHLSIILNGNDFDNLESCATTIIEHCIKNDFQSLKFSYDLQGYPNRISATVYRTEEDFKNCNEYFSFTYSADAPCTIKDADSCTMNIAAN